VIVFSRHSYDCKLLPTQKLSAEVLRLRDAAFHDYFRSPRYLDMVTEKFSFDMRRHIEEMTRVRLCRKLLEEHPVGAA
jgi:hypothetical protein